MTQSGGKGLSVNGMEEWNTYPLMTFYGMTNGMMKSHDTKKLRSALITYR